MSTFCGSLVPHKMHEWGIEANPGEDGPDMFLCEGVELGRPRWYPKAEVRLGPRDTSQWDLP